MNGRWKCLTSDLVAIQRKVDAVEKREIELETNAGREQKKMELKLSTKTKKQDRNGQARALLWKW